MKIILRYGDLRKVIFYGLLILLFGKSANSQTTYFPPAGKIWQQKQAVEVGFNSTSLEKVLQFAESNEYKGSRDLRIAILEGFKNEPYHYLAGPVKKRGAPAGVILKNGFIVARWGDVERVDMTFSVTKSYLSAVAGLCWDEGLLNLTDNVGDIIWDGFYEGEHNSKITWEHLLNQSSDWSGELFGMADWADRPAKTGVASYLVWPTGLTGQQKPEGLMTGKTGS